MLAGPDFSGSSRNASSFQQQTAVVVAIAKLGEPQAVAAGNAAAVAAGSSYVGTGRALSAAAGRISYCYGLKGPAGGLGCVGGVYTRACASLLLCTLLTWSGWAPSQLLALPHSTHPTRSVC